MATTVAVLGNCQGPALGTILSKVLPPEFRLFSCPPVHTLKDAALARTEASVQRADIVIHQPLSDKFGRLATDALPSLNPKAQRVSYPSIHFAGLFPQLAYLRNADGSLIRGPLSDYHDLRIVEAFLAGEDVDICLRRLAQHDERMVSVLDAARQETMTREQGLDIHALDLIEARMQTTAPLFTFNHPTNAILIGVARRVLERLGLDTSRLESLSFDKELLGNVRATVPPVIVARLGLPWRREVYELGTEPVDMGALVTAFYRLYAGIGDFPALCRSNRARFPIEIDIPGSRPGAMHAAPPPRGPRADRSTGSVPLHVATTLGDRKITDFSELLRLYRILNPQFRYFVDGGAGLGETAEKILKHIDDPDARLVAYEPNPANVASYRFRDARQIIVEAALSDADGSAEFHVSATTQRESATNPYLVKGTSFVGRLVAEGSAPKTGQGERFRVRIVRMKDDLEKRGIKRIDFVKLDLQGAELPALQGMGELLSGVHWMWLEYSGQPGLLPFLAANGFVLFDTEYLFVGDIDQRTEEMFQITRRGQNSLGRTIAFGHRRHLWRNYGEVFTYCRRSLNMIQTDIVAVSQRHLPLFLDAALGLLGHADGTARLTLPDSAVAAVQKRRSA